MLQTSGSVTDFQGVDMDNSTHERFWAKVEKTPTCWNWTGTRNSKGYGRFARNGNRSGEYAHRIAYELASGIHPGSQEVDHTCHNPACVRPAHLRLATHKQNTENRSGAQTNNIAGERGVYAYKRSGKPDRWRAVVQHHGKKHSAGVHDTIAEAAQAAANKRNELFTHNDLDRG